jgi:hypothetical protein
MRTGVFEWMGVQACKMAKGDKTQVRYKSSKTDSFAGAKVQILAALRVAAGRCCSLISEG